ncbi:MAG: ABC transporter permease [Saprospiraceae bacterium]
MRTILILIKKELLQVFRNKAMLPLLSVLPIVQLILLSYAATNEVSELRLAVFDEDQSTYSNRLLGKFTATDLFILTATPASDALAMELIQRDEVDLVLHIPPHFEKDFLKGQGVKLQVLANAINGTKGGLASGYAAVVIQDFGKNLRMETIPVQPPKSSLAPSLEVTSSNWYNPSLDYKVFMVPGILGVLVIILTLILSAMNIVREREIGTIEQLNVTPIKKYQFILGKLLPFLIIGLGLLTIGLIAGKLIFDIPMVGSLGLVFLFCMVDLIVVLGLGLLISTFADTQQQAMFIAWFFMMIFILMSGLFTPIESMPEWAQILTYPNPIAHFVSVMRLVLLKGSDFADIQWHFWTLGVLAIVFSSLAVMSYRKTS